jgi:hypothetical protein
MKDCPQKPTPTKQTELISALNERMLRSGKATEKSGDVNAVKVRLHMVEVSVGDIVTSAVFDSGADRRIIPRFLMESLAALGRKETILDEPVQLRSAIGTRLSLWRKD